MERTDFRNVHHGGTAAVSPDRSDPGVCSSQVRAILSSGTLLRWHLVHALAVQSKSPWRLHLRREGRNVYARLLSVVSGIMV